MITEPRLEDLSKDVLPLDPITLRDRIAHHDDSLEAAGLPERVIRVPEPRIVVPIHDASASDLGVRHIAPVDLRDLIDVHCEEDVGFLDVAPVQTTGAMRAQIHPELPCALHRRRVGRVIGRRFETRGSNPDIRPSEALRAQQLGRERAADDVSETDEEDRSSPGDPSCELPGVTGSLLHSAILAGACEPPPRSLPKPDNHLTQLPPGGRRPGIPTPSLPA